MEGCEDILVEQVGLPELSPLKVQSFYCGHQVVSFSLGQQSCLTGVVLLYFVQKRYQNAGILIVGFEVVYFYEFDPYVFELDVLIDHVPEQVAVVGKVASERDLEHGHIILQLPSNEQESPQGVWIDHESADVVQNLVEILVYGRVDLAIVGEEIAVEDSLGVGEQLQQILIQPS